MVRGFIYIAIKGQRWAKGGHCRGGTICGGGTYKIMGTAVGGRAAGIVQRRDY